MRLRMWWMRKKGVVSLIWGAERHDDRLEQIKWHWEFHCLGCINHDLKHEESNPKLWLAASLFNERKAQQQ